MKKNFLNTFLLSISVSYPALSSSMTVDGFDGSSSCESVHQSQSSCSRPQNSVGVESSYLEPQGFSIDDYLRYPSQDHKMFATGSFQFITDKLIANDVHGFHPRLVLMNVIESLKKGPQKGENQKSFYQDQMRKGFFALYMQREFTPEELTETDEFCQLLKSIKVNVSIKNKRKTTQKNVLKAYGGFSSTQQTIFTRLTSTFEMQWPDVLNLFTRSDREVVQNCCQGIIGYFQQKFSVNTNDVLNQDLWEENPEYLKAAAGFGHFTAITKCRTLGATSISSFDLTNSLIYFRLVLPFSFSETLFNLGQAYSALNQEDLSLFFYEQAARKDPSQKPVIEAQKKLGVIYALQKKPQKVIEILKNSADRGDLESMSLMAQAYLISKNITSSQFEIIKKYVIQLPSDDPEYVRVKALYYDRLGDTKSAKFLYGKAAEKGNVEAIFSLGSIAAAENDYENAIKYFSDAMKNNNQKARNNLASLYFNLGRDKDAETVVMESLDQSSAEFLSIKGVLEYKKHNIDLAMDYMKRAADKGDTISRFNLGLLAFDAGEYDKAIQLLKASEKNHPDLANSALGKLYQGKCNYGLAVEHFLKAIEAGHNESHLRLAETYTAMENYDQAHAAFRMAIELGVQDAELFYWIFLTSSPSKLKESDPYVEELDEDLDDHSFKDTTDSDEDLDEDGSKRQDAYLSGDSLSNKCLHNDAPITEGSHIEDTSAESQNKLDFTQGQFGQLNYEQDYNQEKYVVPELSKRSKRLMARAEKARKREKISLQSSVKKMERKTYKNISVSVLPKISDELKQHPLLSKIKGHLSHLANGDKNRGKFEKLVGYDDVYSTRLTRVDRLVFKAQWDDNGNLKEAKIISVYGHYKGLDNVKKSENSFQLLTEF